MPKPKNKNQDGFTLLELLIVIVIIGILALIIVPSLMNAPKSRRDVTRKNDLASDKTALDTYYNDFNSYPGGDYSGLGKVLVPNYLPSMPLDPKAGQSYVYTPSPAGCTPTTTACASYTLDATLENGKDPDIKAGTTNTYQITSSAVPTTTTTPN